MRLGGVSRTSSVSAPTVDLIKRWMMTRQLRRKFPQHEMLMVPRRMVGRRRFAAAPVELSAKQKSQ